MHKGGSTQYRADIDGLRAVAVLSVFAYHLRPDLLHGGGLGVDIFFVISGYLIGGIILREAQAGTFSFLDFYERRLRRIGPALLVVVLAVLAASAVLVMPGELEAGGVAAIAAILFASNLYFWSNVDYFNEAAGDMPLLHTWSLGVEEQFYIFAPILLILLVRTARRWMWPCLMLLLAGSLALNIWQVRAAPIDAFYLPQGRAWELLAGVLIHRVPAGLLGKRWLREGIAWLAALVLGASLFLADPQLGWPGLLAVPPVLATALLILTGQQGATSVARLLSLKPAVWVGLISYSLYLWHWPAIVFYREIALTDKLSASALPSIVGFAFIAAYLSWRFVEQPFRNRQRIGGRKLLLWTGGGAAICLTVGAALFISKGAPDRFDPETARIAAFGATADQNPWRRCIMTNRDRLSDFDEGCLDATVGKRRILLLGDSHANMFHPALADLPNTAVTEATYAACEPDWALSPEGAGTICGQLLQKALSHAEQARPDLIVVTWQWRFLRPDRLLALGERLKRIGAPILLIGPTPDYRMRVPKLLAAGHARNEPNLSQRYLIPYIWGLDENVAPLARQFATYLSPRQAMCDDKRCDPWIGANPAYYDRQHFTAEGARTIFRKMVDEQLSPETIRQLQLK